MIRMIIIAAVFGIAGALIAQNKGRNPIVWFFLCTMPVLIIAVVLLPMVEAKGYTKKCPHCAEIIKEEAKICKHCGIVLP